MRKLKFSRLNLVTLPKYRVKPVVTTTKDSGLVRSLLSKGHKFEYMTYLPNVPGSETFTLSKRTVK